MRSVDLAPVNPLMKAGAELQFTATATFSNGSTVTQAVSSWSTEETTIATVSAGGLVRGVSEGTTHVRAMFGGVTGRTAVSVQRLLAGVFTLATVRAKPLPQSLGSSNCPTQPVNCVATEYVTAGTLTLGADGTASLIETRSTDELRTDGSVTSTKRSITYMGPFTYGPFDKVNCNGGITIHLQPPAPSLFGSVLANDTEIVLSVPSSAGPAYEFVRN